jgi:hypothetical protein
VKVFILWNLFLRFGVGTTVAGLFKDRRHESVSFKAYLANQRRKAMAQYYTGLDVSMDQTDITTVDDKGKIVFESSVKTDP